MHLRSQLSLARYMIHQHLLEIYKINTARTREEKNPIAFSLNILLQNHRFEIELLDKVLWTIWFYCTNEHVILSIHHAIQYGLHMLYCCYYLTLHTQLVHVLYTSLCSVVCVSTVLTCVSFVPVDDMTVVSILVVPKEVNVVSPLAMWSVSDVWRSLISVIERKTVL